MPELDAMLAAATELGERDRRYVELHGALAGIATNSHIGAPVRTDLGPLPVILFSPGGNVSRHAQTSLAEQLASRGYVFVAMSHAYSSLDVAPATGFSMSIEWGLEQDDAVAARAADDRLADTLTGDAHFVRAQLLRLQSEGDPLGAALDVESLVIAGHSRGGTTVGRVCASEPAFAGCVVLDNIGPDREQETGVAPPFLTLRSPWEVERVAQLHAYLGRTGSRAFDVELSASNHFSCTDLPLYFEDLRGELAPEVAIEACAQLIDDFVRTQVRGDARTSGWPATPPGTALETTVFTATP